MALPTEGPLDFNSIHIEAGGSTGTAVSLNDADIRALSPGAGKTINPTSGTTISVNDLYGASSFTPYTFYNTRDWWGTENQSNDLDALSTTTLVRASGTGLYVIVGASKSATYGGGIRIQADVGTLYAGYNTFAWNFEAKNSIDLSAVPASARSGKIRCVFGQSYISANTTDRYYGRVGFMRSSGTKDILISPLTASMPGQNGGGALSDALKYPNGVTFSSAATSPSRYGHMTTQDTVQDYIDAGKGLEYFVEHFGTSSSTGWTYGTNAWRFDVKFNAIFIVDPSTPSGIVYADNAGTEYLLLDPNP